MSVGKVWLVGAGPGDPGLITCRGREVLERADVVIFDRLIGDGVLALMPRTARCINVGKEGGGCSVPQREIEALIIREALKGSDVVRLKGGDPFLFGRGGEEVEALLAHGIPYEIVPGVTSAIAAPECAGIPVTHRGLASSLHIVTAHTKEGGVAVQDYGALAQQMNGTLVFLMGVSAIPEICSQLKAHGFSDGVPLAAVEWGTTAHQRTLVGSVGDFEQKTRSFDLHSPAVVVVGSVAALAPQFAWRQKLPLWGKKVLVTRPANRQGRLSEMLRDLGAEVVEFPCIVTVPLETKLPPLSCYNWIAFTSVTGVECFFARLAAEERDVRELNGAKIAAIGPATAGALMARGLHTDLIPAVYDGVHLAEDLMSQARTGPVLLFRALNGSPELTRILREREVAFEETPLYRTETLAAPFQPTDVDAVMFTSASTVRGFKKSCPELDVPLACCIGIQTAREAERLGLENIRVAASATLEDLINTLKEDDQL